MMFEQAGLLNEAYFKKLNWGGHEVNEENLVDSLRVSRCHATEIILDPVEENIGALKSFVQFCQDREVQVVFISCPIHHSSNPALRDCLITWKFENFPIIPYLNFTNFKVDDANFLDREYLNESGAKLFTPVFLTQLNAVIKEKAN